MPLFGKNSNANSANRRRRRAQLLLNNSQEVTRYFLLHALYSKNAADRKKYTSYVIQSIRRSHAWNGLVPRLNKTLMNKLKIAYNNAKPELNKREQNAAAKRQAQRTNERRKANQHAKFLLTNEGKQWQRKNNEARRLKNQRNNENARRRENARKNVYGATGGVNVNNFYYRN